MRRPLDAALSTSLLILLTAAAHAQTGDECGGWQIEPSPNPGPTSNGLTDIAIRGVDDVLILGGGSGGLFLTRWDGAGFNTVPWPDLGGSTFFDAMATVGDHVWLGGFQVVSAPWDSNPFFARFDGADWDQIDMFELEPQTVWPFAPRSGTIEDIDGVAENDVWAVGFADGNGDGVGGETLVMTLHFDGSGWTEVVSPPTGDMVNRLFAVDMLATDDGWAVGRGQNSGSGSYGFGLILHWDGTSWSQVPNPAEDMQASQLKDVVAIAPSDVWAVGDVNGVPLFVHYDGTDWTATEIPETSPASVAEIAAIASDDIWAVAHFAPGYYHYDGTSWTVIGRPEVPGAVTVTRGGDLEVAGPCDVWSVGGWSDGLVQSTLVERLRPDAPNDGDYNGDGLVNITDLLAVLGAWGPCAGCPEDLDSDGTVGVLDLLMVLANWS